MQEATIPTASDTLVISQPRDLSSIGLVKEGELSVINAKNFKTPYAHKNSLFRFLPMTGILTPGIKFKKSFIGVFGEYSINAIPEIGNSKRIEFDSCNLRYLTLSKQGNETAIYNSNIGVLGIDSSASYSLRISYSEVRYSIVIDNCRSLKLDLQKNNFLPSADARVFNSSISEFGFDPAIGQESKIIFQNDSITNNFYNYFLTEDDSTAAVEISRAKEIDTISFSSCYINSLFQIFPTGNKLVFDFDRCTFGPEADLRDLNVAGVIFRNCFFPIMELPFGLNDSQPTQLTVVNCDIDHLRFNFTPNIRLTIPKDVSSDVTNNTFQRLLSKFTNEGKPESLKQVNLQYKKYSKTRIGFFLSYIWLYHGYMPELVFIWTIGLLLLFFVINLSLWNKMYETYPLIPWSSFDFKKPNQSRLRLLVTVILYTLFIFFL